MYFVFCILVTPHPRIFEQKHWQKIKKMKNVKVKENNNRKH
jgi:hypothetical protein